jgi:hypothetical protein
MTLQELINRIGLTDIRIILAVFMTPPVLAVLLRLFHPGGRGAFAPWNYLYSFLVYLTCVPGICAAVLTAYSLFFIRKNLLEVNFVVYFLPIISMILTLAMVRKQVAWEHLPGVDRLYGLMIILVISFSAALFIEKMRVWVVFGGTIGTLIMVALFCFAALKLASRKLFSSKDEGFPPSNEDSADSETYPISSSAKEELKKLKKRMK